MNRHAIIESGLWFTVALGAGTLMRVTVGPVVPAPARQHAQLGHASPRTGAATDSAGGFLVSGDLFRLERRPAAVAYDAARVEQQNAGYVPPRPALVLRGIVRSDSARAVIEGFPGVEGGRMVATGDVIGGLRIAAIGPRSVRIVGTDTTWLLTIQRAAP